ncbi:hypothetical protein ACFQH8_16895 [Halomicroarcula sp. GCM10025710]
MSLNHPRTTVRIGLDVERDKDRELLSKLFTEYDVFEFSGAVPDGTDLCIIGESALERSAERFATWHSEQSPVFAPVALLTESEVPNSPEALEETLSKYVDSIYSVPMSKAGSAFASRTCSGCGSSHAN